METDEEIYEDQQIDIDTNNIPVDDKDKQKERSKKYYYDNREKILACKRLRYRQYRFLKNNQLSPSTFESIKSKQNYCQSYISGFLTKIKIAAKTIAD